MKKLLLLTAAFASMLFASCSKEEMTPQANETTVTYTVEIPSVQTKGDTKAIGDGFNVDELVYEVWKTNNGKETDLLNENTGSVRLFHKTAPMVKSGDKQSTVISLNLVQDQEYTILFWAQKKETGAYNTENLTNVHYAKGVLTGDYISNREDLAAFYGVDFVSDSDPKSKTVYLTRPFAQLNLGTKNTATDYIVTMNTTEVIVENVPMAFNVATKESSETVGKFVFSHGAVPGDKNENGATDKAIIVNDQTYEWAAMNYMFATNGGQTATVKYAIKSTLTSGIDAGKTTEAVVTNVVENVPLKENFRTNIVGNLLTSTTDYTVVIDANWADSGDGNVVEVWDGKNVQEPYFNESTQQYEISLASELAWLANAVNGTLDITTKSSDKQTFAGETFILKEDIDLKGALWTPIGAKGEFKGTFDGNGKTIKNLNVNITDKTAAGLFANAKYVRNLYVNGAVVKAHYKAAVIVGNGLCSRIENCHVSNAEVIVTPLNKDDGNHVGGIVGYLSAENEAYVKGCTIKQSTIKGYRDVAAIAGTATASNNNKAILTNNIVDNVIVIADQSVEYVESGKAANAGKIVGRNIKAELDNNTAENVTIKVFGGSDANVTTAISNAADGDTIYLKGEYGKFPSVGKALTIICEEGTVFKGSSSLNLNPETVVIGATFSNPNGNATGQTITGTFKNCTFTGSNGARYAYAGETCVFEGCVFDGSTYGCHFDGGTNPITFKNCTFSGFNAFAAAIPMVTFDGCTFKSNGKSNYNGANLWGSATLINTEFIFDGSVDNEWIDVIGKDKTYEFTGCKLNNGSIFKTDYIFSRNAGTVITIDGVTYTYAQGGYFVTSENNAIVTNMKGFNAAIANSEINTIYLANGVYEGLAYVNGRNLNIEALNEGEATINGKLGIAASGKTVNVKGIVFENSYSGSVAAGHQYLDKTGTYCIGLYCASVNVENCTFNLSKDGGINFYSFNAPDRCTVKNCTFNANGFRPIISKANLTVEGCTFNDQNKYALQVWGNQNTGNETVVFTNNIINKAGETSGVAAGLLSYVSVSGSYPISNVAFTIQNNTPGYNFIYDLKDNVKITECTLNGNTIAAGQCISIPGVTDVKSVVMDYEQGATYVGTSADLTAALSANKSNIVLLGGVEYEGTFKPNVATAFKSSSSTNKATIKGRVNVGSIDCSFEDIKFGINDASKHINTFSGAPYKYPGIVVGYGAALSFEGCEFETSLAKGVCGINSGNHADNSDLLTVNNCKFTGDFYAIRTRTLFNITNNVFDIYTNQGTLAAVWTWGNGNSGANNVTFTGNTNINTNKVYGVQMTASNFVYDYVNINVQNNVNFYALADGVIPARFNGTHTFAEGSETF